MPNTFHKYFFFVKKNSIIIFFSVENQEGGEGCLLWQRR